MELPRIELNPKNSIGQGVWKDGRKFLIFKCGTSDCTNTIVSGTASCSLKRSTGYCTACHHKKKPYGVLYNRIVDGAAKKGLENSLTYLEFLEFTKNKYCTYCNSPIDWMIHVAKGTNGAGYNLDRKDSKLGYSVENCVVCCKICNWSKNGLFSHEEFLIIGKAIGRVLRSRK